MTGVLYSLKSTVVQGQGAFDWWESMVDFLKHCLRRCSCGNYFRFMTLYFSVFCIGNVGLMRVIVVGCLFMIWRNNHYRRGTYLEAELIAFWEYKLWISNSNPWSCHLKTDMELDWARLKLVHYLVSLIAKLFLFLNLQNLQMSTVYAIVISLLLSCWCWPLIHFHSNN